MRLRTLCIFLSAAGLTSSGAVILGDPPAISSSSPETIRAAEPAVPAQTVGPNDLLSLSVSDSPELTRNFRVAGDGTLTLPWLTEQISAAGRSCSEIAAEVATALQKEQILVRPIVSVIVLEYHSVPVSVLGAVRHPLTFQASGNVTLLDAITRAEGLTVSAGPYILISRPRRAEDAGLSAELLQRVPVKGLIDDADPTLNMRLYGGEEVRVPEAGHVYVLGNVRKSGAFQITDNGDATVLKLVAESEGLLPFTNKSAYIYRRVNGQTERTEIQVPLKEIIQRKANDVPLQANDILYVPDNKGKRITAQTLERMANFGVGTASGYVIFH